MTDKERLEEIGVVHYEEDQDGNQFALLKEDDYWFLKEQAERTSRLVEILRSNKEMTKHRVGRIKALEDELGDLNNTLIKRSVKMSKYAKESEKLIEVLEWLKADAENAIGHEWELDPVSVVKNIDEALERFK